MALKGYGPCPECDGLVFCFAYCRTGWHREEEAEVLEELRERPRRRPRGPNYRPASLDAPLRDVVKRLPDYDVLACNHRVYKKHPRAELHEGAVRRRCLLCCAECPPEKTHVARYKKKAKEAHA